MRLARGGASLLLVASLVWQGWAVCGDWQSTAEARLACCTTGDCPMHEGAPDRAVAQAAADACCTMSERERDAADQSAPSSSAAISLSVLGPLTLILRAPSPDIALAARSAAPLRPQHVPKYVLLSVFLV